MNWTKPLPSIGQRVHLDSGHVGTSWSGEVRAIVDDEQIVIRRWKARGRWVYFIEWRYSWELGWIKGGPLPRRKKP